MRITIAEHLQPFSHTPGIYFILPGSNLRFQIFPAFLRIHDLSGKEPILVTEVTIGIRGPVEDFTAMQDLEKGQLKVWGHSADGYFRYRINALESEASKSSYFAITIEKNTNKEMTWSCSDKFQITNREQEPGKETLIFSQRGGHGILKSKHLCDERLSLGNHKTQDWDKIKQRIDMAEIFPLWLRLGQLMSPVQNSAPVGTMALLSPCQSVIDNRATEEIIPAFRNLFLAGFDSGLSPRLIDEQHLGFQLPPIGDDDAVSPLFLLSEGAALIRSLFVRCEDAVIHILPALPPEFHCGRFLQVHCPAGKLEMEWSKKTIRRMIFVATVDAKIHFAFQQGLRQFRLRQKESERGVFIPCASATPMSVVAGGTYLFDRFEK